MTPTTRTQALSFRFFYPFQTAAVPSDNFQHRILAGQARALFTEQVVRMLPGLARTVGDTLAAAAARPGNAREVSELRDAQVGYQKNSALWVQGVSKAWAKALPPAVRAAQIDLSDLSKLELVGNEAVESSILASRLALRLLDFASWELNDLRLRIQSLEGVGELHKQDIFRPEILAQRLVEEWKRALLPQSVWVLVQDTIQKHLAQQVLEIYHATNEFLIQQGVMPEIDLRPLVRRTPSAVAVGSPGASPSPAGNTGREGSLQTGAGALATPVAKGRTSIGGALSGNAAPDINGINDSGAVQLTSTPMTRVLMRAQGVMARLKQLLTSQVSGFDATTRAGHASPPLAQVMTNLQRADQNSSMLTLLSEMQGSPDPALSQLQVDHVLNALRQRTTALKQAASNSREKATIEIVALMFQSILAEDRIPPAIRVWFARLQMPVLRVAIAEPEFFSSLEHPARQLIDRMGSCVLGFDVTVTGSVLESEIRRVVQVIEQYPETGRRVFQLVYDEFDKFLSRFFSEQGNSARVVSVAQQIEQKETMVIQYTIEMRKMLNDLPVRDEIREFLFRVWAEVLAIAAMKNGPQHTQTLLLKRAAADLVWSASAKPNREDRTRVIAGLPKQLQLLRQGMATLGLSLPAQEAHLKIISDTLADAFLSKTDAIPMEQVEAMARRLTNLEDYLSDEDVGDLPLDTASLVMMIGIDAANIEVIGQGGTQANDAMRAWARELQPGTWFSLDHNAKISRVQFVWRSERKQLHLFAAADGRNFLIQMRRLAAYLQAGLLVPTEEEALTVRATRDALAKLDANPERLLE